MWRGCPESIVTFVTRRSAMIALGGFGIGLIGTSAIGASWLRNDGRPSLTVLGCGRSLSVLLASGGARLLLLSGTDVTDFGNALSSARYPILDRIDLLLVPGQSPDTQLVNQALRETDARNVYTIGPALELLDAGIPVDCALTATHSISLPGKTEITVVVESRSDGADLDWSMLVRWRTHRLLVDPGGSIDGLRAGTRGASTWIRTSGAFNSDEIQEIAPSSIIVAATAMDGPEMREVLRQSGRRVFGYRVHGGDNARLELAAEGLRLPENPANDPDAAEE
jgi:hypothetical protein